MDVRRQVAMTFHLDKCIGCHTCSIACKNLWTDRRGAEYMWWNNVETKPGTGYPTRWEDQEKYRGGWEYRIQDDRLRLKLQGRAGTLGNLFHNPVLPSLDDYYHPWTYAYRDLFDSPEGNDQPTARPISMVTGEPVEIEAGPNWDDDLGGSEVYAANDPNLDAASPEERRQLAELERLVFFYLPRICNHCVNPGCTAACPAGAIYKRGEDGIVLVSQEKCRAWRMCISGCPYKKVYFNWSTGKSEKCILCYPRLESGQAPACFHSCVGRIRYLGVLLYDADRTPDAVRVPDADLVESQRSMILDPFDPKVVAAARASGIGDEWIDAARKSPVYKFVKEWQIALPLHPEFRTLPSLFYIPPLSPVMAVRDGDTLELDGEKFFTSIESARVPVRYLASLFAAGREDLIQAVLKKLLLVREFKRHQTVGGGDGPSLRAAMEEVGSSPEELEAIFQLTSLPTFEQRFVLPPYQREFESEWPSFEGMMDPLQRRGEVGFGTRIPPQRGL